MKRLLIRWIVLAISLVLAASLTQMLNLGFHADTGSVSSVVKLFIGVAILSLLNATLGNLLKFLTLPLNCLTLGLVSLIINAAMLQIAGSLEYGFRVDSFLAAFIGSLILSLINGLLGSFVQDKE